MVRECYIQTVHFSCRCYFYFLTSVAVCYVRFPGLMPMCWCRSMITIIYIKLNTIFCKCSRIFYYIFHSVHNDMGSHWHKWLGSIYCNRMISLWICATCSRTTTPLPATDWTVTISAGHHLSQWFPNPDLFLFCYSFSCRVRIQPILFLKNLLDLIRNLCIGKTAILDCQVRNKLIRVVSNLINLELELIIVGMVCLHLIDLLIQCIFQCYISIFRSINIFILTGITGRNNGIGTSLE